MGWGGEVAAVARCWGFSPLLYIGMLQEDGPGWSCIMYFAIKEETVEAMKDLEKAPAGVRLFSEFMK